MKNESIATSYCINIPKGATNGDVIKAMFPKDEQEKEEVIRYDLSTIEDKHIIVYPLETFKHGFDKEWWNAPYKAGEE